VVKGKQENGPGDVWISDIWISYQSLQRTCEVVESKMMCCSDVY
jgi:hypothetical protein